MKKRYSFYIVDNDRISLNLMIKFLEKQGQAVSGNISGVKALPEIIEQQPDCIVLDLMMPEIDGMELINALPFFAPLFRPGSEIEIFGPSHGDITVEQMISAQMDCIYFPFKVKEFSANISFRDLKEETVGVNGKRIKAILLNHPGYCLGYRVEYKGRSVCYITDNELYPPDSKFYNRFYMQRLVAFVKNTDALIADATYQDKEYEGKTGWGHSSVTQVVNLAEKAGVKSLYFFHHDPDHSDIDVDAKLDAARALLGPKESALRCVAPREKERFLI